MSKECWQLKNPTCCFLKAGGTPCREEDCLVDSRIRQLQKEGIDIDSWWKIILLHSTCRISSLSPNNQEYKERTKLK